MISRRALLAAAASSSSPLRVVVTGGHPGDPECGCAGTIARYRDLGHEVTLLYLNRGEGYCGADPLDRCGAIRTAEAEKACRILNARPLFVGQVDGQAIVDESHAAAFTTLLLAERPEVVFTHWPLDRHADHRAISMMTLQAWLKSGNTFSLYYYEVADDTMMFTPAEYVDISSASVETRRRAACYAHASQQPEKWYPKQVEITRARGRASGYTQAEAFVHHRESKRGVLP